MTPEEEKAKGKRQKAKGKSRIVLLNLLLTGFLSFIGTQFHFVEDILSVSAWGAGLPSSSGMTAFATLRPWWLKNMPEAVVVKPSGGIEPVVRIPRSHIHTSDEKVLPQRSIGYDVLLGALTAVRSVFSDHLIYDFAGVVRLQQWLLVLALTLMPVAAYLAHPEFRTHKTFVWFNAAYLVLLLIKPNKSKFLTEGIIDSALANPLAIFSVAAFFLMMKCFDLTSKRSVLFVILSSLFLGFCSLVRGEFFFVFLFVYLFLFIVIFFKEQKKRIGFILSIVFFILFPLTNGIFNKTLFGHFVPLRMGSGQNLFEPIGQYPNPYGIEYNDVWLEKYLAQSGIGYVSFEADEFLAGKYFELLKNNPKLFLSNFYKRVQYFSSQFFILLNFWTIPLILGLLIFYAFRDQRFQFVSIPLVLAIGYILFFGWTNNLLRLVAPAHFLISIFICFLLIYLVVTDKWQVLKSYIPIKWVHLS